MEGCTAGASIRGLRCRDIRWAPLVLPLRGIADAVSSCIGPGSEGGYGGGRLHRISDALGRVTAASPRERQLAAESSMLASVG